MKLAIIIEQFNPEGTGAERSTAQIARELAQRGHAITVVTAFSPLAYSRAPGSLERRSGELVFDWTSGVRVTVAPQRGAAGVLGLYRFANWARQLVNDRRFDTSLSMSTCVPAAVLQPRTGTVREMLDRLRDAAAHDDAQARRMLPGHWRPRNRLMLALERRTVHDPQVKQIAAPSRYVMDQLRRHYRVSEGLMQHVPNGAEVPVLTEAERKLRREQVRQALQLDHNAVVYLWVAHQATLNGVAPLLRALRMLLDRGERPLLVLGGGQGYILQRLAAELDLRDVVRIVGPTQQVTDLYRAADVTVHPTFYDPASKVVIESLMLGLPVITTSRDGASAWVAAAEDHAARGIVLDDPADVALLARAMSQLADAGMRARCRDACAGLDEQLSMRRHVDQLEQILRACMNA